MWETELSHAATIAREAGRILLDIYASDFVVDFKGQGQSNPVTEADRRANTHIVARLRTLFPDDGVVAEESEAAQQTEALKRERIWYVDPLDGTKEFVAKNGEFSVMIGLTVAGRAQLGVVFQPSEDKLYRGALGQGAFLDANGQTRELHVSTTTESAQLGLIVSRSHRSNSTTELMRSLQMTRETTSGSVGLKVGHIAEQHADLYVHVSDRSGAWDTCAPEAILIAAGGRFTDLAGDPFVYGRADLRTRRGILACNSAAFDVVAPVVRGIGQRAGLLGARGI
jgi:3'(2'), 5'-bisphosphate nucleotidase